MPMKLTAILTASVIVLAAPAAAYPLSDRAQFHYNTGELATAKSTAKLYKRLESRAHAACFDASRHSLSVVALKKRCEAQLKAEWVAKIGDNRLSNIHAAATGASRYAEK